MSVRVFEQLSALPEEVSAALRFPAEPRFQRSLQWFENLYTEALADAISPRIYVYGGGGDAPVALFCAVRDERPGVLSSLTNFYTLEFGLSGGASDRELRARALAAIAAHIASEQYAVVDLSLLFEGDAETEDATAAFINAGFSCETFFQFDNWTRPDLDALEGSYHALLQALPSKLRNTLHRKARRLGREHDMRIRLLREPGPELDQAIEDYVAIYNRSWKDPEPFERFMPGLIGVAASLGALTLGVLYLDDTPVAAQVWLHEPGRSVIYKLAHDEAYKHASAGSVLSGELFRDTLSRSGIKVIDYGVGSEAYKRDWMTQNGRMIGLRAMNRTTLRGRAAIAAARVRRVGKRLLGRASD
ncbi:MAG: GNAT family N-acetyltransferase [Pseudomonadota bacterium]